MAFSCGTRRAIFLGEDGALSIKDIADEYNPVGDQVLVKVTFSAINPADLTHSFVGLYGSVAGLEWTGTVIKKGDSAPFNVGQRLFGMSIPGRDRPIYLGGHQDYIIADGPQNTWPVPPGVSDEEAVSIPVAAGTACDALFNTLGFGCEAASLTGRDPKNVPILIWGGASAVGCAAIQVAKSAGFAPILTTASPKNHRKLEELGARAFEYNSPTVVDDIQAAVAQSGRPLRVVFDAVCVGLGKLGSNEGKQENNTPDLARRCISNVSEEDSLLASVLPVAHDPTWRLCIGIRPYGNTFQFGGPIPQDPSFPVRMKTYLDWLAINMQNVWSTVLRTKVVQGAERGIEEIKRVGNGGASMEKVLIEHPM